MTINLRDISVLTADDTSRHLTTPPAAWPLLFVWLHLTPDTVTLHVPFRIVKRGGRKEMQLPEGAAQPRRTDNTLVKALARAFRWKRMLESGEFATTAELAEREGIATSYMTRILRLTLLAPDIVEAILDGKQGAGVILASVLEPFPMDWDDQKRLLYSSS